ncbi:MAG: hypothetical protein E7559_00605 [Ruminococcaceae bacterium]|nr:hypothetical protein [Oscillospiraceae bacterium]
MNNRIRNTLQNIAPTEEQKARMLSRIDSEADRCAETSAVPARRSGTKWLKVAAVAAALCLTIGMTAFAEEIGSLFDGLFVKDSIVAQTVLTGVYNDNDGHVNMAVEELMSDGIAVRTVIRYQALDEQGEEWLDTLSSPLDTASPNAFYGIDMNPVFRDNNTAEYGVNWSHGTFELEDMRTETERCFISVMNADRYGWGTEDVQLEYTMPSGNKSALLCVTTNMEKKTLAMEAPENSDKLYTPLKATLSPLSFVIEGEEHGIIDKGVGYDEDGTPYYYQRMTTDESIDSLSLHLTDGTWVDLLRPSEYYYDTDRTGTVINDGAWQLCAGNNSSGENSIIIASTSFRDPIDISTIAGFKLDGVYYEFD